MQITKEQEQFFKKQLESIFIIEKPITLQEYGIYLKKGLLSNSFNKIVTKITDPTKELFKTTAIISNCEGIEETVNNKIIAKK